MQASSFMTRSLQDWRIMRTLAEALNAVDPYDLVSEYLERHPLPPHKRLFLLGLGKAAEGMTQAAATLKDVSGALAVTKQAAAHASPDSDESHQIPGASRERTSMTVLEAGHPIPDDRSLAAGRAVTQFISNLHREDLLVCLISGGGSALIAAPPAGISLADLQALTSALLHSGASIEEINVVRRRLDNLKGGGLAVATPASILSLILSDVVGDRLEAIASGPTAPEPAALSTAMLILRKYGIRPVKPIAEALQRATSVQHPAILPRVRNIVVGNNRTAVEAALNQARTEGFKAEIAAANLQGEAADAGRHLAARLSKACLAKPAPFCMVAGGETTVSLGIDGKGGRNQEMALAAVDALDGHKNACFVSLATDGEDGPTDAAGAVVTGETKYRATQMGMDASDYLARHDAYHFFDALGDLLRPGYTATNVNDLMLLCSL